MCVSCFVGVGGAAAAYCISPLAFEASVEAILDGRRDKEIEVACNRGATLEAVALLIVVDPMS